MKRFYKEVSIDEASEPGFLVLLDGRSVKTPSRRLLSLPAQALAQQVAAEWDAQDEMIDPETMPLMQLCTTVLDQVAEGRDVMAATALSYLDTDLLCYRAPDDEPVAAAQKAAWDPFLDWFSGRFGAALATTTGLSALRQDQAAHEAVRKQAGSYDEWHFGAFQMLVPLTGSVVLALAVMEGHGDTETIYRAVNVEEDYKAAIYNESLHGPAPQQEKRQNALRRDLDAARLYLDSL